jgi:hypothetical protein
MVMKPRRLPLPGRKSTTGSGPAVPWKPSQNSFCKADTYVRSVAESGILGLVHLPSRSEQLEIFASAPIPWLRRWTGPMTNMANSSSTPVLIMGMDETIIDRIAFGGVKELEELYQEG